MDTRQTILEARENAARGAKHFDRIKPKWYEKINLNTFDIALPDRCVVAQSFGKHYNDVLSANDLKLSSVQDLHQHGYAFLRTSGYSDKFVYWGALQDAWINEITNRRKGDNVSNETVSKQELADYIARRGGPDSSLTLREICDVFQLPEPTPRQYVAITLHVPVSDMHASASPRELAASALEPFLSLRDVDALVDTDMFKSATLHDDNE